MRSFRSSQHATRTGRQDALLLSNRCCAARCHRWKSLLILVNHGNSLFLQGLLIRYRAAEAALWWPSSMRDPCIGGSLLTAGDDRRSMNTIGKAHKLTALSRNRWSNVMYAAPTLLGVVVPSSNTSRIHGPREH